MADIQNRLNGLHTLHQQHQASMAPRPVPTVSAEQRAGRNIDEMDLYDHSEMIKSTYPNLTPQQRMQLIQHGIANTVHQMGKKG
jgi:hypothetical protein